MYQVSDVPSVIFLWNTLYYTSVKWKPWLNSKYLFIALYFELRSSWWRIKPFFSTQCGGMSQSTTRFRAIDDVNCFCSVLLTTYFGLQVNWSIFICVSSALLVWCFLKLKNNMIITDLFKNIIGLGVNSVR